jgi:hypothetical protein
MHIQEYSLVRTLDVHCVASGLWLHLTLRWLHGASTHSKHLGISNFGRFGSLTHLYYSGHVIDDLIVHYGGSGGC